MNRSDLPLMTTRLNALSDVFGARPFTPSAIEEWYETLKEFPFEKTMDVLNHWAKTHRKTPLPVDVWESVNEKLIDERELKAKEEAKQNKGDFPATWKTTPHGLACIAKIKEILKGPTRSPIEHWNFILLNFPKDSLSHRYAKEALAVLAPQKLREPGEDDEPHDSTH